MKNKNELEQLVEDLRANGFSIPKFEYDNGDFYGSEVIHKEVSDLNLEVSLYIYFDISPHTEILTLGDLIRENVSRSVDPSVGYKSLYSHEIDLNVNPKAWKDLASRVKKELGILQELDDFLPKDENSQAQREDSYNGKVYGELVRAGKLRWFDLVGERFPYVVTTSNVIGNVGRPYGGLYFVATDVADEPWKELIVAYHERHHYDGHECAEEKERELAMHLGKLNELSEWRKSLSGRF